MSSMMPQPETAPILAVTVSRDVQNFDLLIEDMETALGEDWGELGFAEALAFFGQPEAEALEFIALAIDAEDEENISLLTEVIGQARSRDIAVILIAEDVTPPTLHALMRQSEGEFVPYPLPEGELDRAIERVRSQTAPEPDLPEHQKTKLKSGSNKEGVVIAVHGLAGGSGATTIAVNLAWELATIEKEEAPSVCLLDLDFQFGSAATFLDLPRRESVFEMLADTESMDEEVFAQALVTFDEKLQVLTSPADIIPLDFIGPEDVSRLIAMARAHFEYVVIDMPSTLVQWTETVLSESHVYFCPFELDMRSAQNALRFKRALQAEGLPVQKLRYVMNRAPKFTDLSAKGRVKRMAESLDITIEVQLPDGGKPVTQANDHGLPLAASAPKNPLRKEIQKLATQIHEFKVEAVEAA